MRPFDALTSDIRRLAELLHESDPNRRQDEKTVNDSLPHDPGLCVLRIRMANAAGIDKGTQEMDGRNSDDSHGELYL